MRPTEEQWAKLEEMRSYFCCLVIYSDNWCGWDICGVVADYDSKEHKERFLSGPYSYQTAGEAIDIVYERWQRGDFNK